jgi:hypothetical protein
VSIASANQFQFPRVYPSSSISTFLLLSCHIACLLPSVFHLFEGPFLLLSCRIVCLLPSVFHLFEGLSEMLLAMRFHARGTLTSAIVCLATCVRSLITVIRQPLTSIHNLDDDSLLNVFYICRPSVFEENEYGDIQLGEVVGERWWYKCAQVCRRW